MDNDFYIGYLAEAPASYKKWAKRFIWILLGAIVLLAAMITLGQKGYSKGVFQYGNISELEGMLQLSPVPHLRVYNHKGEFGENKYQTVILTGSNKFGAVDVINAALKHQQIKAVDSLYLRLQGTLIYNDGKALFELTKGDESIVEQLPLPEVIVNDSLSNNSMVAGGFNPYQLEAALIGEIIDPKCYFGAMKPGTGKVHKSCAVRCISGGIPPVLKVSTDYRNEYYILYGYDGPVNDDILDYVAENVEIIGRFEPLDDWFVLLIDPKTAITLL